MFKALEITKIEKCLYSFAKYFETNLEKGKYEFLMQSFMTEFV